MGDDAYMALFQATLEFSHQRAQFTPQELLSTARALLGEATAVSRLIEREVEQDLRPREDERIAIVLRLLARTIASIVENPGQLSTER